MLGLVTAAAIGVIAFVLTNPFFVLRLDEAIDEPRTQTATAHRPKLGQRNEFGAVFGICVRSPGRWAGARPLAAGAGALW